MKSLIAELAELATLLNSWAVGVFFVVSATGLHKVEIRKLKSAILFGKPFNRFLILVDGVERVERWLSR